jgi:hypothetical protein
MQDACTRIDSITNRAVHRASSEQFQAHVAMDVGQAKVSSLIPVCQAAMVHSQGMQDCGL